MVIVVEGSSVSLREPGDCKRFHVETSGADGRDVGAALDAAGAGRVEGGDAFIAVEWVRAAGREADVPDGWDAEFEAMLAYAASKGWLDDTGSAIRAHIEPT